MRKGLGGANDEGRARGPKATGKVAGGIAAKKTSRTGGVRPTVPPGGIRTTPVNAGTTIGKRLSKLASR